METDRRWRAAANRSCVRRRPHAATTGRGRQKVGPGAVSHNTPESPRKDVLFSNPHHKPFTPFPARAGHAVTSRSLRRDDGPFPIAMPLRMCYVAPPRAGDSLRQRCIDGPHDPARNTHDHRARRHVHSLGNEGSGGDHAARSDARTVQYYATHADEALILNRTAVQDRAVPHPDLPSDAARQTRVGVHHAQILDVRLLADLDGLEVASKHGAIPVSYTHLTLPTSDLV